jgi:hypothetical protein
MILSHASHFFHDPMTLLKYAFTQYLYCRKNKDNVSTFILWEIRSVIAMIFHRHTKR